MLHRYRHVVLSFLAHVVLARCSAPLRNFQVAQPVDLRNASLQCRQELLRHTFGNSYGQPARHCYHPPPDCGSSWDIVVLNYTATSNGTQYDRLSTVWLSHVEILRTSTAEPTRTGIVWTVLKDVTRYAALFAKPGPLLLDLGNMLDPSHNLTGEFNVTLSMAYYMRSHPHTALLAVLPISSGSSAQASYFDTRGRTHLAVPKNAVEAHVEVYASGNALEEFWYSNAPDSLLPHLSPTAGVLGKGPYREVQLLIDGRLAGVIVPFPVIYTGGIIPTAWRPIAAYGTFDAPTHILDVTPFLPLLCDDALHAFEIRVVGEDPDAPLNPNWWVSGSMRFVQGATEGRTTGMMISYDADERPDVSTAARIGKDDLVAHISAVRRLRVESMIAPASAPPYRVTVKQQISFDDRQVYRDAGFGQTVAMSVNSVTRSVHGGRTRLSDAFAYALYTDTLFSPRNRSFAASISQSVSRRQTLSPSFNTRAHHISTTQNATGSITLNALGRVESGRGETEQAFDFGFLDDADRRPAYWRSVKAVNGSVVRDAEGGPLAPEKPAALAVRPPAPQIVFGGAQREEGIANRPRWLSRYSLYPGHA